MRVKIGVQTSEVLDYVPASYLVIEHRRPTYACLHCLEKAKREAEARAARFTRRPRLVNNS
jgi:transposase